jgi:hypothetical protein
MGTHPFARLAVVMAAMAVFVQRDYEHLGASLVLILAMYALVGEVRLFLTFCLLVFPLILASSVIWFLIQLDVHRPELWNSLLLVFDPQAQFFSLLRAVCASAAIFFAFRTIPDGELCDTLGQMGVPQKAATTAGAAMALVSTVRDSFEQSHAALRVQGVVGPRRWSVFRNLGQIVGLTWVGSLSAISSRAEFKWDKNGYYTHQLRRPTSRSPHSSSWDTLIAVLVAFALIVTNVVW